MPKIIEGKLLAYSEQGTEGCVWCIDEADKDGYDGLHKVESGNLLKVFTDATKSNILWQGIVALEYDRLQTGNYLNPDFILQDIFGVSVRGLQKNLSPHEWANMFFDEKFAELHK